MQYKFDILISAVEKGLKSAVSQSTTAITDGFKKSQLAVRAFNAQVGNGHKVIAGISTQLKALVGAYVGLEAITRSTQLLKDADQAAFNLQSSVAAANREFENVGSVAEWEASVRRLSGELRVYSEIALKSAISRTVDMTKRLGLSKEQMEEVIRRSADLGAGKTDLEGAIERVTAALRGEAEASEYLGLTLNEDYVKAWYAANVQTEKAWKDLTDLEKAQVRYALFLQQSQEMQGRAAASAETYGGALALIRKEAENAVVNNEDLVATMNDLAKVLRENADDLGWLVSQLVSFAARAVELTIKYKEMLLAIGGTAAAALIIGKFISALRGLNTAFTVLTGAGFPLYVKHVNAAITHTNLLRVATASLGNALVLATGALGAFYAGWKLGKVISDLKIFKGLSATVGDAVQYTFANIDKFFTQLRIKYLEFKKMKREVLTAGLADTSDIDRQIAAERRHLEVIELVKKDLLKKAAAQKAAAVSGVEPAGDDESARQSAEDALKKLREELAKGMIGGTDEAAAKEAAERQSRLAEACAKSQVERMKAASQTALAQLETVYDKGEISLQDYFTRRQEILEAEYQKEMEILRRRAAAETDPVQKLQLEDQLFEKEEAHKRELIRLTNEQAEAERRLAENKRQAQDLLDQMRGRVQSTAGAGDLTAQFQMEQGEMDRRHAEEIERLREHLATKEQLEEAYRLQKLEKDRLLLDQDRRIWESNVENIRNIAGGVSDIFQNLYELSGKKQKEFFYIAKAAALAEAIVNTSLAITKALATGGPYAGPALAAIAAAQGAVQIAKITAQQLAGGGPVLGHSPSDTADNVPIMATAGEFMQPVASVRYYGTQVMEAIRRRLVPRELFAGLSLPDLRPDYSFALAAGGGVPRMAPGDGAAPAVNILNVIDPSLVKDYLATTEGENLILNVVRRNPGALGG